ncbi:hypothetical protein Tsubulata_042676 [Turnera subulata]|uniref:RING-type domain-containing protein n=1 Tax=Turnera subulata TaxID=218843 RepID=A0A9Q0FI64_9ROSI|nr:hypothetical protein Tsubulata_042676 [Turnera subulata]
MGLSSFPTTAAEGVLPVLVMNTVLYVALLKNMVRSLLQVMGANWSAADYEENPDEFLEEDVGRERRISITQFKSLCHINDGGINGSGSGSASTSSNCESGSRATNNSIVECCVCLCGFEAEEEGDVMRFLERKILYTSSTSLFCLFTFVIFEHSRSEIM